MSKSRSFTTSEGVFVSYPYGSKYPNENKAIPEDMVGKVCMHCLSISDDIKPIKISSMGYGSIFDMTTTQIDLCDECKSLKPKEWWDMKVVNSIEDEDWTLYKYEFEDEIYEFINSCPNAGKELFMNRYDQEYYLEPQDWIDYELKSLSHEKCKEYGLYSHQEIDAYHDRFPKCGNVGVKIYPDESRSTECLINSRVHGNEDGSCSRNISPDCFGCESFKLREAGKILPIVDVTEEFYKREIERTELSIKIQQTYLERLKNRTVDPDEIY